MTQVTTRNTTATGVVNNGGTLSQTLLDENFVDLQQNKAGLAINNSFTSASVNTFAAVSNLNTLSYKTHVAGGAVNTYTITDTGLATPYVNQLLVVDFSAIAVNTNNIPTLQINGGAVVTISTGTAAGMQVVTGGLAGIQRLLYTGTFWFAIDQLGHYITTTLVTDQLLQIGHTFTYDMSAVGSLLLRIARTGSNKEEYRITGTDLSTSSQSSIFLVSDGTNASSNAYSFSSEIKNISGATSTISLIDTVGLATYLTGNQTAGSSFSFNGVVVLSGVTEYYNGTYRVYNGSTTQSGGQTYNNCQASTATLTRVGSLTSGGNMTGRIAVTRIS